MYSPTTIIRTISLINAFVLVTISPTARAVDPPPDGGYPGLNTAEGEDALFNLSGGFGSNTAVGYHALYNDIDGGQNTAVGMMALHTNTSGNFNTAIGGLALFSNTTAYFNTAIGLYALMGNTSGVDNTATGASALTTNTTGSYNTATGLSALALNETGNSNTATGLAALFRNNVGNENTASGFNALYHNVTGSGNTATGFRALYSNKTGTNNTVIGGGALAHSRSGDNNIVIGSQSGRAYGSKDGESNNIAIGNIGVNGESNTIRVGTQGSQIATYIAGISGTAVSEGVAVIVDSNGHLGTILSSVRFKDEIKPMGKASEAILALKPVTFHYKKDLDPDAVPQFGLVAEEVGKVNPDLVARDDQGRPYTVRYEAVNAMLLNEFLKEHRRVEEQAATIAEVKSTAGKQATTITKQQKAIEALTAELKAQAGEIQKVCDQLKNQVPAPRVVAND